MDASSEVLILIKGMYNGEETIEDYVKIEDILVCSLETTRVYQVLIGS